MFTDPLFTALSVHAARLITPWNSVFTEPERLDRWLGAARAANSEPLIAFEHARGGSCSVGPCELPSASAYAAALRAFHERYPWVELITPWNEPNHDSQPTAGHPRRAAEFYNEARAACPRCTVVAGDVLDEPGMAAWVREYGNGLATQPTVWGLHNYFDVTQFGTRGVESFFQLVRGDVWLTEVGGLVYRRTVDGRVVHPYDETGAARSLMLAFHIAKTFRDRIRRMYLYQWRAESGARFDAGLLQPDGTPRPSYDVVRREASMLDAPAVPSNTGPHAGDAAVRLDLSKVAITRSGDVRVPVSCESSAADLKCAGRIVVEDARYRRSRLVNGTPRAGVLTPRSREIRLDFSERAVVTFKLPARVVREIRRRSHYRFRIGVLAGDGTRDRVSDHMVTVQRFIQAD